MVQPASLAKTSEHSSWHEGIGNSRRGERESKSARPEVEKELREGFSVLTKYANNASLNLEVVCGHHDRSHLRIRGLEADLASSFAVEPF